MDNGHKGGSQEKADEGKRAPVCTHIHINIQILKYIVLNIQNAIPYIIKILKNVNSKLSVCYYKVINIPKSGRRHKTVCVCDNNHDDFLFIQRLIRPTEGDNSLT